MDSDDGADVVEVDAGPGPVVEPPPGPAVVGPDPSLPRAVVEKGLVGYGKAPSARTTCSICRNPIPMGM